ncbi:glycosyltransferase family 2 protein [Lunatibacter salilacus]|uniref:glycosyltransferase family 2 protein n=1 Tax=Lunatibacter salilacus TaxID=2483804 RepID=UPI00131CABC1|nr:glycosyltransferase family 2 protein [Lunatibacter salilacus]
MRKAAIVILNYNGKDMLHRFLPSVIAGSTYDLVVVDNASTDGSTDYLAEHYPQVELILLPRNGGYSGGYNEGLEQIKGRFEYYLLLNSDVKVSAGWDVAMADYLDKNPSIAATQPKIISLADEGSFDYAGAAGGFLDALGYPYCRGRILHSLELDNGQYDTPLSVDWASGACFCVRAAIFHMHQGFDPVFFAHMEEIDFCWRLRNRGYGISANPGVTVYHLGGGTLKRSNPKKTFLNFRNSLFMLYKNLGKSRFYKLLVYRSVLDLGAMIHFLFTSGGAHSLAVFRAYLAFFSQRHSLSVQPKSVEEIKITSGNPYVFSIIWEYYGKGRKHFSQLP